MKRRGACRLLGWMGSSGHAFIAHTKALSPPAQSKDNGYGAPPHPLAIRPGQRFWPLSGRRRRPFAVRAVDADGGRAVGRRLDGAGETVRVTLERLLALDDGGQGAHYRLLGFLPGRYTTWATVVALDADDAVLVLPEWHPARPARCPARLLPSDARAVGSWMRCTADLSQPRTARLGLTGLRPAEDPGPGLCHRPAWTPPVVKPAHPPAVRDIVLDLSADGLDAFPRRGGLLDVYVHERPEALRPGDRVFLARSGTDRISDHLIVRRVESRPMGACIRCDATPHSLAAPVPIGVERTTHRWRRRWW
jgi:hypothetical protein